jgi:hypothetical protein
MRSDLLLGRTASGFLLQQVANLLQCLWAHGLGPRHADAQESATGVGLTSNPPMT